MLKRFALLAALAAALVTCCWLGGSDHRELQQETSDDFVGLLVFYTAPDRDRRPVQPSLLRQPALRQGTVVTAGHCTEGVDSGRIYFQQEAAPNYGLTAFGGLGGDQRPAIRTPAQQLTSVLARSASPTTTGSTTSRASRTTSTWRCRPRRALHDAVRHRRHPARLPVPSTGTSPRPVEEGHGLRRRAATASRRRIRFRPPSATADRLAYLANRAAPITTYNLNTTANPSQGKGGTCNGDSGGPIFFTGT